MKQFLGMKPFKFKIFALEVETFPLKVSKLFSKNHEIFKTYLVISI